MPLHRPRPLPPSLHRPVQAATRRLVERHHRLRGMSLYQRWLRMFHRSIGSLRSLRWLILPLLYATITIAIALALSLLLFSPWTRVQEIRVIRHDPRIDIGNIQQALSPLFGRRMLLLNRADVFPLLQATLPDLQDVSIDLVYPSRLIVRVMLDPLVARVRIVDEDATAQSGTLLRDFLTEDGMYLQYLPSHVRHTDHLPEIRITDWGVRPAVGKHVLPAGFLKSMREAEEILQHDFGQEVTQRLVFLRAREFHLRTTQWWIWFDTESSLEGHFQRYRLFLQNTKREQVRTYVDLRPRDRVVYQ